MKKKLWAVPVIAAIVVAGYLVYYYLGLRNGEKNPEAAVEDITQETVVVTRGPLEVTVEGTGSVNAAQEVSLAFPLSGRVAEVAVKSGQQVQAGDLLARLDTSELELKVKLAEASLKSAQAQLHQLMDQPTQEELESAEAAYYTALEQYREILDSPSEEEITIAKVALEKAKAALEQAQAAYDKVAHRPDVAALPQSLNLQNATLDYEKALAQYKQATEKPSDERLASAKSNLEKAKAHLEDVKNGPAQEEIAAKRAAVEQAKANLEIARHNLENAYLRAPFSGTVTEVVVDPGEFVGAGKTVIVLSDLTHLQVTLYVDETDVGQVVDGLKTAVSLDAFPDVEIQGTVAGIGLSPEVQSGVVLYPVTVALDPSAAPIRPGMTADGEIIVESKQDALLVPLKALHNLGGRTIVFVKASGESAQRPLSQPPAGREGGATSGTGERRGRFAENPAFKALLDAGFRPVRVTLGTVTDTQAEVLSGLSEGDVVSTASISIQPTEGNGQPGKAPSLFRGIGGPPR